MTYGSSTVPISISVSVSAFLRLSSSLRAHHLHVDISILSMALSHKQPRSCIYFTDRLPVSCGSRQHGGLCCPFEATHAWHSITSLTRTCLCFEYRIVDVRFPIIIPYGYHANLLRPLVTSPGSFASLLYCWLHPENSKITQNISFRLSHINPSPPCLTVLVPFLVDSLYAIAA